MPHPSTRDPGLLTGPWPLPASPPGAGIPHAGRLVTGCYLGWLRRQAGLRRWQAAERARVSLEAIRAVEEGTAETAPALLSVLLERYGVTDAERIAAVTALAQARTGTRDMVYDLGPGWEQRLAVIQGLGTDFLACAEVTWPALVWSGHFSRVMAAQQRLRPVVRFGLPPGHPGRIEALVPESAAYLAYGGQRALAGQIAHVLAFIQQERALVRILPMSAGLSIPPVTQIRMRQALVLVVDAGWTGVAYTTAPGVIDGYRAQIDEATRYALTPHDSAAWLTRAVGHGAAEATIRLATAGKDGAR